MANHGRHRHFGESHFIDFQQNVTDFIGTFLYLNLGLFAEILNLSVLQAMSELTEMIYLIRCDKFFVRTVSTTTLEA